jgi:AraC-like DNA-binding protein
MKELETLAIVLPGIINSAMKHGVDIRAILQKFNISLDLKNITQTSINLEVLHAIVMEVEEASQIPAIGLQTGEDFDFDYMPHLKSYLMSASTLREAYLATDHARKLISPILMLHLKENETEAMLTLRTDVDLSSDDERHYVEMIFSTLKTVFSKLLKKNFPMESVHFRHRESHLLAIYEKWFGCLTVLGAPENVMIFERSILDVPLQGGFPEIHRQAKGLVDQQLFESPLHKGLVPKITRVIKNRKSLLAQPIEHIASHLHMSSRTLQRRLDKEGISISELKDQVRFKLAVSALKSVELSIEEISDDLGYSDRHSFTRAFKRLSGISPSAFRKKHSK